MNELFNAGGSLGAGCLQSMASLILLARRRCQDWRSRAQQLHALSRRYNSKLRLIVTKEAPCKYAVTHREPSGPPGSTSIVSIQYLRGIAAMMVVYHHLDVVTHREGGWDLPLAHLGAAGVDIFLFSVVLSSGSQRLIKD